MEVSQSSCQSFVVTSVGFFSPCGRYRSCEKFLISPTGCYTILIYVYIHIHTVLLIHIHLFYYAVCYCGTLTTSSSSWTLPHSLIHFIIHAPTHAPSRSSSPSYCWICRISPLHPASISSLLLSKEKAALQPSMFHNLHAVCGYMPVAGDTLWGFIAFRSSDSPAAPPLPNLVSLPAGEVVHCCRQIASDSWLLLPLRRAHSQISASSLYLSAWDRLKVTTIWPNTP